MKVITMVGTSLFENNGIDLKDYDFVGQSFSERESYQEDIEELKQEIENFDSAEITVAKKLKDKYENLEVILFASDTVESYFVAEILKEYFQKNDFNVVFNKNYIIKDLNVTKNSLDIIKKGSKNLIKELMKMLSGYNEIINISGGYKATIPLLTLIASYKKINLAYVYQNSNYLIEIPPLPFEVDKSLINYLKDIFDEIDKESFISKDKFIKLKNKISKDKQKLLEYLFEEEDKNITTSTIGDILLEDYLENREIVLIECKEKDKKIDGGRHHDKEKVIEFGKKLIQNSYICAILGSAEYEIFKKDFILEIEPQKQIGVIKIKIPNEEKATILIKTSGRNYKETAEIAKILEKKFNK